jgi:hypothetical protein
MKASRQDRATDACFNRLTVGGNWKSVADVMARARRTHVVRWTDDTPLVEARTKGWDDVARRMSDDLGLAVADPSIFVEQVTHAEADDAENFEYERGRFVLGACSPVPAHIAKWGRSFGRIWKVANWGTEGILGEATVSVYQYDVAKARARYLFETMVNPPTGVVRELSGHHPDLWMLHAWRSAHGTSGGSVWSGGRQVVSVNTDLDRREDVGVALDRMEAKLKSKVA